MAEWIAMSESAECRDHWMYGIHEPKCTGVVWMRGAWHRLAASGSVIGWVACPEYKHLSLEEFKAVALAMYRMGG